RQLGDPELAAAALFADFDGLDDDGGARPWQRRDGWRLAGPAPRRVNLGAGPGSVVRVRIGETAVAVGAAAEQPAAMTLEGNQLGVDYAGTRHSYTAVEAWTGDGHELYLADGGWSARLAVLDREQALAIELAALEKESSHADPEVRSPMPGTVVAVLTASGDTVEAGQTLLAVEAMKMEHQLVAALAGVVHLSVTTGDIVKADQVLATIHVQAPAEAATGGSATDPTAGEPAGTEGDKQHA
ncbi:MAG TPA: biotin/lipoyl-containing protein, partial [Micrococcaceae bacterium]